MLLVKEGFLYICTDVTQGFYLYQSAMLSLVAPDFHEMVTEQGDILTIDQVKIGSAIHLPWCKWVTVDIRKISFSVGVLTANYVLREMHPDSQAYLAVVGQRLLERPSRTVL